MLARAHFSIKEMNRHNTIISSTELKLVCLHCVIVSLPLIVEQVLEVDSEHGKIIVCISGYSPKEGN